MTRRVAFAAPFVVTAALSGCKSDDGGAPPRRRPPPPAPDAALRIGNPPTPTPDAGQTRATIVQGPDGCHVFPRPPTGDGKVPCPPGGPTIIVASVAGKPYTVGDLRYDEVEMACVSPTGPVPCPPLLLPALGPGLQPTRRAGPDCYFDAGGRELPVLCPPDLPVAGSGELVYEHEGKCYVGARSPVQCPRGGALIVVAALDDGRGTWLDLGTMRCRQEVPYKCPEPPPGVGMSCNPPGPKAVACPDALLPRAREPKRVERKDSKCWLGDVHVRCP